MAHIRTQIRDYLKLKLSEIIELNNNIFFDDPSVKQINKFPCVCLVSQNEQLTSQIVGHPKLYTREYQIDFILNVRDTKDIQKSIDDLSILVEEILGNDKNLNGLCMYHQLTSIDFSFSEEEEDYGSLNMSYVFTYRARENDVEQAL
jgi:hypothetical protein